MNEIEKLSLALIALSFKAGWEDLDKKATAYVSHPTKDNSDKLQPTAKKLAMDLNYYLNMSDDELKGYITLHSI
jgi:hypothetical protein